MADFLTRLAGRTLGVAPTVQPMIAPLYAPDSALLAGQGQTSLSVFEEVPGGAPDQPSLWPAGREPVNLPMRESLQEATGVVGQERGANTFANPLSFSSPQDTVFPSTSEVWAGAAQPALPAIFVNSTVNSQNTLSSVFGAGEEGLSGAAHTVSLSSMFVSGEGSVPGAETARLSRFITGEGGQQGAAQDISLSSPATPLPVSDKTSPLRMQEGQTRLSEAAQREVGSASFMVQDYQEGDVPHTGIYMNVHSVERLRAAGNLPQSALSADSRSRASMRRAAVDAVTNRHGLSPEGTASSAPTIQVTIGRIEVRATQPPPAQRQAPRPGPRMVSLEEYLNQQEKGGQG